MKHAPLFLVLAAVACDRGVQTPAGPPPPQQIQTLTVLSVRDDQPVAGATVTLADNQQFATDGQGRVTVPAAAGQPVSVLASGFTGPRKFALKTGAPERLLPDDAQMPAWWIKQALYGGIDTQWLWRPEPGVLVVVPGPEAYEDNMVMDALAEGIGKLNAVHRHLSFQLGAPGQTSGRVVDIKYNPALYPSFAVTAIRYSGATVTGADITFSVFRVDGFPRHLQYAHLVRAVTHELMHVSGIAGHPMPISGVYTEGMMWGSNPYVEIAQPEADILNWMFYRVPGTRPPDDSTGAPVRAASLGTARRIVCELRF